MDNFFNKKRVFITGHTGFKGSWLTKILLNFNANIVGYSLYDKEQNKLHDALSLKSKITSITGDIRDFDLLAKTFNEFNPEIIFHLAAQPLVIEGYNNPKYTYETNIMGTVNILECIRLSNKYKKSFVNITTDKVYKNNEWDWGYRETDSLDGFDPYSNSKSCSELITSSFQRSYCTDNTTRISTMRSGNVIGGGDFSKNRIIPDCIKYASNNKIISVRNPGSTRPYQHVLESLFAYLLIAEKQ